MDHIERAQAEHTAQIAAALRGIEDPVERYHRAAAAIQRGNDANHAWAQIRRETVAELLTDHSQGEVARMLGVTTQRIKILAEAA